MTGGARSACAPLWRVLALVIAIAPAASACSGPDTSRSTQVQRNDAIIRLQCNVPDAELWVDDRFVAAVGSLRSGIALSAGAHRIELRHESHHTFYLELDVAARERRTIAVELIEVLP
ncbi:MAG: hypothetical protein AAGC55_27810 [Myxococcota bacterium]